MALLFNAYCLSVFQVLKIDSVLLYHLRLYVLPKLSVANFSLLRRDNVCNRTRFVFIFISLRFCDIWDFRKRKDHFVLQTCLPILITRFVDVLDWVLAELEGLNLLP
jgi:hypothetical protein